MLLCPVISPTPKPLMVRYAEEVMHWFVEYCAKFGVMAAYTQSDRDVAIRLSGAGWFINKLCPNMLVSVCTSCGIWIDLPYVHALRDGKFEEMYEQIRAKCDCAMKTIPKLPSIYRHDIVHTWSLCAKRLNVCKDIRVMIAKLIHYVCGVTDYARLFIGGRHMT